MLAGAVGAVAFVAPLDEIRPDGPLEEVLTLAGGRDIATEQGRACTGHDCDTHTRNRGVRRLVCHSLYENVL